MEKLKELIQIVSKNKVKNINIIGLEHNYNSLVQRLYSGIQEGTFETDEAAAKELYNSSPNSTNYKKLKYVLEKRLLNTLFFIDVNRPTFNEYQRAYYSCYKDWAAIKMLIGRGGRHTSVQLAERVFPQAKKFELTEITLDLARFLKRHYSIFEGNKKKYDYYDKLVIHYKKIFEAELLAEEYLEKIGIDYAKSRASNKTQLKKAEIYATELELLGKTIKSNKFHLLKFEILIIRYEIINDYQKVVLICNEAIKFFRSNKYLNSAFNEWNFSNKQLSHYILLKDFEGGKKIVTNCSHLVPVGKHNWYVTLELYLLLCLHTKNYQLTYDLFCQAIYNKGYSTLPPSTKEMWTIYEAFIYYLLKIEQIDPKKVKHKDGVKQYRYGKFINNVPTYSKDKRGVHISILIIQILFFLYQKKHDNIIDRIDALEKYSYRYLKNDETFRSNCFIKMLVLLPKCNFHPKQFEIKTAKYLKKLNSKQIGLTYQSNEFEIIPYEELWKFVHQMLMTNKKTNILVN